MPTSHETILTQLNQAYQSPKAQMCVLYGRRRVGKTELIRSFVGDKPHIFFVATLSSDANQLAAFSQLIWKHLHGGESTNFAFASWEAAFGMLAQISNRPVVIISEITYLLEGNHELLATLHRVWQQHLRSANLFLLLCGSYVGTIERELLGDDSPLHEDVTGSAHLQALDLPVIAQFFPRYSPVQLMETWAILGGMPYYLSVFNDQLTVLKNIQRHILHRRGTLYSEPQLLLLEELHDPRNYFSILRAIAADHVKLREISQAAGVGNSQTTGKYLDVLRQLGIVERQLAVTEREPEKSRKGVYRIADSFLRFWFRFVHPNLRALSLDMEGEVLAQSVVPQFDRFVKYAFEEAAQDHVGNLPNLPFTPERVGRWWNENEEIAVVALDESTQAILVGDCHWCDQPVDLAQLNQLRHKAAILNRSGEWKRVHYSLFAKSGFTDTLRAIAQIEGIPLVSVEEMVAGS